MNILFLTWKDIKHPFSWWAEKVIYEYCKWLIWKWHNITWISSWFKNSLKSEIIEWINIIRIYNIKTIYFFIHKWYKSYKKNNTIDVIIDEAGWIPLLSPLYEKKIPIYFLIHHIWEKEFDFKYIFPLNLISRFLYNKIILLYKNKKTITVSESTKNELVNKFNFDKDAVYIIENTINIPILKEIDYNKKENSILFIWRIMPIKRIEDCIKSFSIFFKNNTTYQLNILWNIQYKKYKKKLDTLITKLNLNNKITFIDYNAKNFSDLLIKSKVLLVTSYKEWFWLVVLEWNSYWLPVLWYNVAWLKDNIKNGINWFLIEDWNIKLLANKLSEIVKNKKLYKKTSYSSLNYIKNLDKIDKKIDYLNSIITNY